jgi:pSer/pThr/pTyr-binding forkhead associated (FHA) protein
MSDEKAQISSLVITETCERFQLAGKELVKIGRETDNDIPLSNDPFTSRHHALITCKDNAYFLEDSGSNNGTLLNGVSVDQPMRLSLGDEVVIGRTRFRVE